MVAPPMPFCDFVSFPANDFSELFEGAGTTMPPKCVIDVRWYSVSFHIWGSRRVLTWFSLIAVPSDRHSLGQHSHRLGAVQVRVSNLKLERQLTGRVRGRRCRRAFIARDRFTPTCITSDSRHTTQLYKVFKTCTGCHWVDISQCQFKMCLIFHEVM